MARNYIIPESSDDDDFQSSADKEKKRPPTKKNNDLEKELFDDESDTEQSVKKSRKRPLRSRKPEAKKRKSGSGSEFEPESDDDVDDEESSGEKSENLTDDAISDSDFIPSDEEPNATIDLSSDNESPAGKKDKTQTFDPNSKEFWNKVEELKNKGFSIQQTSSLPQKGVGARTRAPPVIPSGPVNGKISAFTQLYINFEHEKRCFKKCFMMEGRQKQTLAEINSPHWLTPDFVKACIRVVQCCVRIGDIPTAREGVELINNFGSIQGVSALSQAMISGSKVHQDDLDKLERTEKEAMDAMKNKDFVKALELLDKVVGQATACIRAKMTRGDCLAHLGRYVDGAKAASSILLHDQKNVGALFLRGFCLYHKDNIDRAITHFQQVLQINKDHSRAKALLQKARQYREKKEQATKATNNNNIDLAISIYNEALEIDPRNKGTNARLLASRAELLAKMEDYTGSIEDCESALELDSTCLVAMVQRGKCYMELCNWDQAVRDLERVNNRDRHNQENKKKAADTAFKANNHDEAYRLYQEALAVDKHNQSYRDLLNQAKQELAKLSRKDFYGILELEPTCGESEIRKAYFKKSKEYHPDKHAGAAEDEKEELSNKFKLIKEAYETLSDISKRNAYDSGAVKPPPGGWYQDLDPRILEKVHPRAAVRGRGGIMRGGPIARGFPRGMPVRGGIVVRGNIRGGRIMAGGLRPGMRGVPMNAQFRGNMRGSVRHGVPMRPGAPMRGGVFRGPMRGGPMNGNRGVPMRPGIRPMNVGPRPLPGGIRPGMNGKAPTLPSSVTITPMSEVTIDD